MFKNDFDAYVCEGDTITCEKEGFTVVARLEHDCDTTPSDFDCYSKRAIEAWKNDEWHFFGVVLSVSVGEVEIADHAASLWGIEGNFPSRRKNPNKYFREVANDLLDEAIQQATVKAGNMIQRLSSVA